MGLGCQGCCVVGEGRAQAGGESRVQHFFGSTALVGWQLLVTFALGRLWEAGSSSAQNEQRLLCPLALVVLVPRRSQPAA